MTIDFLSINIDKKLKVSSPPAKEIPQYLSYPGMYAPRSKIINITDKIRRHPCSDEIVDNVLIDSHDDDEIFDLFSIPRYVKRIHFDGKFNQKIKTGDLPSDLETLEFTSDFNQEFSPGSLPTGLKGLYFYSCSEYNHSFGPGVLPDNLERLVLKGAYNTSLCESFLPLGLKFLSIGGSYSHQICPRVIPKNLAHFQSYLNFDQFQSDEKLFRSLKTLDIKHLDKLPDCLISPTIEKITWRKSREITIENNIPDNAQLVILDSTIKHIPVMKYTYASAEEGKITGHISCLPSNMEHSNVYKHELARPFSHNSTIVHAIDIQPKQANDTEASTNDERTNIIAQKLDKIIDLLQIITAGSNK